MTAAGMADADGMMHVQVFCHRGHILTKDSPVIRQFHAAAAAVASRVQCKATALGKHTDNTIPASAVKSGSVGKEKRRVFARPVPHRKLFSTFTDELQLRSSIHLRIFPCVTACSTSRSG